MSRRSDLVPLGDMYDTARRVSVRVTHVSKAEFDSDENLQLAVTHLLQIIGEAATRVSAEMRAAHPEIAWEQIKGMRHRIVHDYTNVDFDLVWEAATTHIPALLAALAAFVPPDPPA